jgi:hypothetical protein
VDEEAAAEAWGARAPARGPTVTPLSSSCSLAGPPPSRSAAAALDCLGSLRWGELSVRRRRNEEGGED